MRDVLSFDKNVEMAQYGIYDREETGLEQQEYIWGDWIDSNGDVHPVRYKSKWGEHVFTDEEKRMLLEGKEISFPYKNGRIITGHLQYYTYKKREYFGFKSNYPKDEYELKPVYHQQALSSTFELDLRKENEIMAEYMRVHYYAKLWNEDSTRVNDFQRITDLEEQKKGVDVIYTHNGTRYVVDEKAQMDYIYHEEPLPTFSLELLCGSSGAVGWFVNDSLKTEYYMFIWPHADSKPLSVDRISYAYYALINKRRLQIEVENRFGKNKSQLLEYAKRMTSEKMGEKVYDKLGTCIGYRYKESGFDDYGYLYYTLSKQERPVNLIVRRNWLEKISENHGIIINDEEAYRFD